MKNPQSIKNFAIRTDQKGNYRARCRDCTNRWSRTRYVGQTGLKEVHLNRSRNSRLKNWYGIDLETYNMMWALQEGKCAICHKHQTDNGRRLAVDHEHSTGKIRNLLCQYCNTALGLLQEDLSVMSALVEYLKAHK